LSRVGSDNIKGVGPKTALKLIREHKNIEGILETIDRKKYTVPPSWIPGEAHKDDEEASSADEEEKPERPSSTEAPAFVQARGLFLNHETEPNVELKWKPCQAEELTKFLVDDMGFNPDRVASSIDKLKAAFEANKKPQTRMDSFFAVKANPNKAAAKRKPAPAPTKPLAKKGRGRK
jgi:flap endonuclease-1